MKQEIILFDEPISAFELIMVGEVQAIIKELKEHGLTTIVVTYLVLQLSVTDWIWIYYLINL